MKGTKKGVQTVELHGFLHFAACMELANILKWTDASSTLYSEMLMQDIFMPRSSAAEHFLWPVCILVYFFVFIYRRSVRD